MFYNMLCNKFFLLILLEAAVISVTFSHNSGRIQLSAVYIRRIPYDGEKNEPEEQETQYSPILGDTLSPYDEERSQTSYGFDSPGVLDSASIKGRKDVEQRAPFTIGTDSHVEGTLDGNRYYPVGERNLPNWNEGALTSGPSENRANNQQTQSMGGTYYYTGGSSTVQEGTGGGKLYTMDTQPIQPFNQLDERRESSSWGATTDQQISTKEGTLYDSLETGSSRGSAYNTDTQPAQNIYKWAGGSGSSDWGSATDQQIHKEQGMLDGKPAVGSDRNGGTSHIADSITLQSGRHPTETQPYYSELSTGGTESLVATSEGKRVNNQPFGAERTAEYGSSFAGGSLSEGTYKTTESQPSYNIVSTGVASVLGGQTKRGEPTEVIIPNTSLVSNKEKTSTEIRDQNRERTKSRGGTQIEGVHPVKAGNDEGLDNKSPNKNIQNNRGEEKEAQNKGTPDKKGEEPHKEADEGEAVMHLESSKDTEYYGRISLGTAENGQEQWFTVLVDTGSADLWVPTSGSCIPDILRDCRDFRGFDGSKSCTFKPSQKPFVLTYGDGTMIKGKLATDVMKLGSGKTQIIVPEMLFGLGETRENNHAKADGVFGLGFKYGSGFPGKRTTPFQAMVDQAKIQPQFGIFLNRKASGEEIGELVLGGHDEDLIKEEFTFVDVRTTQYAYRYWIFKLDGISVGDHQINYDTNIRGLADSGATLIVAPSDVTDQINTVVWGSDKQNWKRFFDCNTVNLDQLPDITFTIKDKPFVLTPQEYIGRVPPEHPWNKEEASFFHTEERCVYGISSQFIPNEIILGQVFMRVYYTKFDWEKKQIGFARAKHS